MCIGGGRWDCFAIGVVSPWCAGLLLKQLLHLASMGWMLCTFWGHICWAKSRSLFLPPPAQPCTYCSNGQLCCLQILPSPEPQEGLPHPPPRPAPKVTPFLLCMQILFPPLIKGVIRGASTAA